MNFSKSGEAFMKYIFVLDVKLLTWCNITNIFLVFYIYFAVISLVYKLPRQKKLEKNKH